MKLFILICLVSCIQAFSYEPDVQVPSRKGPVDPLEIAGNFEGDIAGVSVSDLLKKNAVKNRRKLWPNGIVHYDIAASFSSREKNVIRAAMNEYHKHTCIKFVQRTSQPNYIYLTKGRGCSSNLGKVGRRQKVTLGKGCVYRGIVMHELMHAVGFWHEQSRADRDKYITVLWGNIKPDKKNNFITHNWNEAQSLGVPYDTGSIMHYGKLSFSKNGRSPTILQKTKGVTIGQRKGFSKSDIKKLNLLYKCHTKHAVRSPNDV